MTERRAKKIVVIDDNVQITRLLRGILVQEGYRVVITNDPVLGQDLVRRENPDLVVMDVCMPDLDGWELCRRIRDERSVPILVLSVLAEEQHVERTFECGATAHMTKPFSIVEFLEQVRSLLPGAVQRLDVPRS